jgi:hypothetical protein
MLGHLLHDYPFWMAVIREHHFVRKDFSAANYEHDRGMDEK